MGLAVALAAGIAAAPAVGALPGFGTAPVSLAGSGAGQAELFDLRIACHAAFDRLVLRTRLGTPSVSVRYVSAITGPSGRPVSLPGAKLRLDLRPARGHTGAGAPLLPAAAAPGCRTLRQLRRVEDFEGVVVLGLGVATRRPFRVFRLSGPARVVVDVEH